LENVVQHSETGMNGIGGLVSISPIGIILAVEGYKLRLVYLGVHLKL